MARLDHNQQQRFDELVSELTIQRAKATLTRVVSRTPSVEKLLVVAGLETMFELRAHEFGEGQNDYHGFLELADKAGAVAKSTRMALLVKGNNQDAIAGGSDRLRAVLGDVEVTGLLAFPRRVNVSGSVQEDWSLVG